MNNRNLPAVSSSVEVRTIDDLAGETAQLWKTKWAALEKANPNDLSTAAAIIIRAHPWMTPLDVTNFYDFLGGKLVENAKYWVEMANQSPEYDNVEQEPLYFEDDPVLWKKWLGAQDPDTIAAAVMTLTFRRDRPRPQVEVNYCKKDDPILYETRYLDDVPRNLTYEQCRSFAESRLDADAGEEFDRAGKRSHNEGGGFWIRVKALRSDWRALALKKARTTSSKRSLSRSFSLEFARLQVANGLANKALAGERISDVEFESIEPVQRPADTTEHPAIESPPSVALPAGSPEQKAADASEDALSRRLIEDKDRRRMHVWLNEREIPSGRTPHDELKHLVAEVQGRPVDEVTSKSVTYGQYERIRELCERYPMKEAKDSDAPVQRPIVNPPRLDSDADGEGDGKAGQVSASPASGSSSIAEAERALRCAKLQASGGTPCLHMDDPHECPKCIELEDRRLADDEAKAERDAMQGEIPLDEGQR